MTHLVCPKAPIVISIVRTFLIKQCIIRMLVSPGIFLNQVAFTITGQTFVSRYVEMFHQSILPILRLLWRMAQVFIQSTILFPAAMVATASSPGISLWDVQTRYIWIRLSLSMKCPILGGITFPLEMKKALIMSLPYTIINRFSPATKLMQRVL